MIVIVDTSALVRLFIPDGPVPEGLEQLVRDASSGDRTLAAPELLAAEVAQVFHKKRLAGLLSAHEFKDLLKDFLALPVKYFAHKEILPVAAELALSRGLTVYDALFLALAQAKGGRLITADRRLATAARALGLAAA